MQNRRILDQRLEAHGIHLDPVIEATSTHGLVSQVQGMRDLMTVLPDRALTFFGQLPGPRVRPLPDEDCLLAP